jgi:cytochrome b
MDRNTQMIKVWDPIVRLGHWMLAVAFFTAYFTEEDFLEQHVWAGYVVGAIVCLRFVWGFIGSKHARFSDFVKSPAFTLRYIADLPANRARRYLGHNPAGGAMTVALLLALGGTVWSGLMLYAIEDDAGPLAGWVAAAADAADEESAIGLIPRARADADNKRDFGGRREDASEEFWEEIHELLANLTLILVGLHIAGVLFSSYQHKENLIWGMFTGRKRRD